MRFPLLLLEIAIRLRKRYISRAQVGRGGKRTVPDGVDSDNRTVRITLFTLFSRLATTTSTTVSCKTRLFLLYYHVLIVFQIYIRVPLRNTRLLVSIVIVVNHSTAGTDPKTI